MKKAVLSILWILLVSARPAVPDKEQILQIQQNPIPHFDNIARKIEKEDDRHSQSAGSLWHNIQTVSFAIHQEILLAESPGWLSPSSERLRIIKKWGPIVERYAEPLVVLALQPESYRSQAGNQSLHLLNYCEPSPKLRGLVIPYLEASDDIPLYASRLLFEHRLLKQEDVDALRSHFRKLKNNQEIERWAQGLSEIGMTDGLPLVQTILEEPMVSADPEKLLQQYGKALYILGNLGTSARQILPILDQRILDITAVAPNIAAHFKNYASLVRGDHPMPPTYAKNGSGVLTLPAIQSSRTLSDAGMAKNGDDLPDGKDTSPPGAGTRPRRNGFVLPTIVLGLLGLAMYLFKRRGPQNRT